MIEYYKTDLGTLYYGNYKDVMPLLNKINLLLTDPPYRFENIGGAFKKDNPSTTRSYLNDLVDIDCHQFEPDTLLSLSKRLMDKFSAVIFCNKYLVGDYVKLSRDNEYIFDIHTLNKRNPPPFNNNSFLNDIEFIMNIRSYGSYYNNTLPHGMYYKTNTINCQSNNIHPAQKNIDVVSKYISILSKEGDLILDPFLGSGTTAVACEQLGRRWVGIEMSKHYCEVAKMRIMGMSKHKYGLLSNKSLLECDDI